MKNISDVIAAKQAEMEFLRRDIFILREAQKMIEEPTDAAQLEKAKAEFVSQVDKAVSVLPHTVGNIGNSPTPASPSPAKEPGYETVGKKMSRWP
jgi:hypothetical protein